jgi:CRP-like cAMP-binding protein
VSAPRTSVAALRKGWCVARRAGGDEPLPLVIVVPPGREVIRQGEPYADAWVVRTGALLMEVVDRDGHALALDVLGPGDLVGGPPDAIADASVRALLTSHRFGRPVPRGRQVALPLTQEHLAALTGSTRESVNRALSYLAKAGRLERRAGRYVIGSDAIGPGGSYPSDWRSAREQELQ